MYQSEDGIDFYGLQSKLDDRPAVTGFVSIRTLIERSAFVDAYPERCAKAKVRCLDDKLDDLTPRFIASIQERGIVTPVCYDPESDTLLNGHHRVVAAWLLGVEFVPYTTRFNDSNTQHHDLPSGW